MIRTGEKWAALECIFSGRIVQSEKGVDADGNEYDVNTYSVKGYKLGCLCGKIVTVLEKEFKGKRLTRDCGCGRSGFSGEHCIITFSTNSGVKGHLQDLAKYQVVSVSHIINTALREYFERRTQELDRQGEEQNWDQEVFNAESKF